MRGVEFPAGRRAIQTRRHDRAGAAAMPALHKVIASRARKRRQYLVAWWSRPRKTRSANCATAFQILLAAVACRAADRVQQCRESVAR